jgi:hypothetical protein
MESSKSELILRDPQPRALALREGFKRLGIVLAVIVAFAVMLWRQQYAPVDPPQHPSLASLCRVDYAKAHSATDTAYVDGHKPAVSTLTAVASVSCGQLRRAGALKL